MSALDPTEELRELENAINAVDSTYSDEAIAWVDSAHETAEGILETVDAMQSNGVDAPTLAQKRALYNIYAAACRWMHRTATPWEGE